MSDLQDSWDSLKPSYKSYGFVNIEKAKELGLKIEEIDSPYDIWKHKDLGYVFGATFETRLNPVFIELEKDPAYKMVKLYCGN